MIFAVRGDSRIRLTASVVLPEPLSPMIASVSPRRRSNETSRTACTGPAPRGVRDGRPLTDSTWSASSCSRERRSAFFVGTL